MRNLPVAVADTEIEEMFNAADTDQDNRLSYQVRITNIGNHNCFGDSF